MVPLVLVFLVLIVIYSTVYFSFCCCIGKGSWDAPKNRVMKAMWGFVKSWIKDVTVGFWEAESNLFDYIVVTHATDYHLHEEDEFQGIVKTLKAETAKNTKEVKEFV